MTSFNDDYLRRPYEFLLGALLSARLKSGAPASNVELTTIREQAEDCIDGIEARVGAEVCSGWSREELIEQHAIGAAMDMVLEANFAGDQAGAAVKASNPTETTPIACSLTILVADNFDYQSKPYVDSQYSIPTDALNRCKFIVDRCLEEGFSAGMSAKALYEQYKLFGDDPYIVGEGAPDFSAWDYAFERAGQMCVGHPETRSDGGIHDDDQTV